MDNEMTPAQRIIRARIAAHASWSRTPDRAARTAPAREAALSRFCRQVDPDFRLPEHERLKLAESARRAYFTSLAYRSSRARANKKRE
jgi:hypothetical protein